MLNPAVSARASHNGSRWTRLRLWALVSVLAVGVSSCRKGGVCGGHDLLLEISGNHGHLGRLSAAELVRGAGSYRLEGGSHEHSVRLSDDTIAALKAGRAVDVRSSSQNGHVHALRLRCSP
jgi:hypothetical protein